MDPAGPVIPEGVRAALLGWFSAEGTVVPTTLWQGIAQREGYGNYADVEEDIRARFGDDDADRFKVAMRSHWERDSQRMVSVFGVRAQSEAKAREEALAKLLGPDDRPLGGLAKP